MAKLYVVSLSDAERLFFHRTIKKGSASACTITRARILLKADRGPEKQEWTDTRSPKRSRSAVPLLNGCGSGLLWKASKQPSMIDPSGRIGTESSTVKPKQGLRPCAAANRPRDGYDGRSICSPTHIVSGRRSLCLMSWCAARSKKQALPSSEATVAHPT